MTTDALALHPFFAGLPRFIIVEMATMTERRAFADGDLLLREDREADALFLVVRGNVSLEVHAAGGPATMLETIGPGGVIGFSWLFPPAAWHLDARATTDGEALRVDGARLRAWMEADHGVGYAVAMRLLAAAFDRLQRVRLQRLDVFGKKA